MVEWCPVSLLWTARIRSGGLPALSSGAEFARAAPGLLDVRHWHVDPDGHRVGDHSRCRVRNAAQEKSPRVGRNAVRPWRDPSWRSQRSDQRNTARRPGHRSGLVPAGHAAHDADLFAHRGTLGGLSETERLSQRMANGHLVLPVHPSADSSHVLPDPAARHPTFDHPEHSGRDRHDQPPALAGAIFLRGPGRGPCRILDSSRLSRGAVDVALPRHSPFVKGALLDRGRALSAGG